MRVVLKTDGATAMRVAVAAEDAVEGLDVSEQVAALVAGFTLAVLSMCEEGTELQKLREFTATMNRLAPQLLEMMRGSRKQ